MKKAYIFLADGFEVVEALGAYDVFKRGDIDVKTVSISESKNVAASNKIKVETDLLFDEANYDDADLIYLPGGFPGYQNLANDARVGKVVISQYNSGKLLAAICGAPTVLKANKIAEGKKVTAHSSCASDMSANYVYTGKAIEHDGNLYTAIGAGHSIDFAIELVLQLCGEQAVEKVKKGMEL